MKKLKNKIKYLQSYMITRRDEDYHSVYDYMEAGCKEQNVYFYRSVNLRFDLKIGILNGYVKTAVDVMLLTLLALQNKKILVREYQNIYLPWIYILAFFLRTQFFLIVNHNFNKKFDRYRKMPKLPRCNVKYILHECSSSMANGDIKNMYLPMLPKKNLKTEPDPILRIGFVLGKIRNDKSIQDLATRAVELVTNIGGEAEVYILASEEYEFDGCDKVNFLVTQTRNQYIKALGKINVGILEFDYSSYQNRTSGVLVDVINMGIFPFVKGPKSIRNMINKPYKLGETYNSNKELLEKISKLKFDFQKQEVLSYEKRSEAYLIKRLKEILN